MTFSKARLVLVPVLAAVLAPALLGDVEEVHYYLRVGDKAPVVAATDDQGKKWTSAWYLGKKTLVMFFYEGDFMKACTQEAREMQSILVSLRGEQAEVVGLSGDSPASHQRFKKSNKLNLTLLCDEDSRVAHRFGVTRSSGGVLRIKDRGEEIEIRRSMTAGRWTFIIDKQGTVAYKKMDVKPAGHAKEVLAFVRRLNQRR